MPRSKKSSSKTRRAGNKATHAVEKAMHEFKRGDLRMGRSGRRVVSRKQAVAIGLSQGRRKGRGSSTKR